MVNTVSRWQWSTLPAAVNNTLSQRLLDGAWAAQIVQLVGACAAQLSLLVGGCAAQMQT
jgi:hypothetical protein